MTSHETVCLLNTSDSDAHVQITVFFTDREPVGPHRVDLPARRTKHLRFNDLRDPAPIRAQPTMPASLSRTFQSLFNIRDWIPGRMQMLCSARSLLPAGTPEHGFPSLTRSIYAARRRSRVAAALRASALSPSFPFVLTAFMAA
jgi:sensory rhodopsin transducer